MSYLQKSYFDLRLGMPIFFPFLSMSNFLLIAYNFTGLKDVMGFELFAVLLAVTMVLTLVIIGRTFRKVQLATESDLGYERQKQSAKTQRVILENLLSSKHNDELVERIAYLKKIEVGNV